MRPPRILFVTQYHVITSIGGTEEQGMLLSTEMARRGWDVHYASEMPAPPQPEVLHGVRLHALPPTRHPWQGNRRALRQLLHELQPDVIYNRMFNIYTGHALTQAPPHTFCIWATAAACDGFVWRKLRLFTRNVPWPVGLRRLPFYLYAFTMAKRGARRANLVIAQHQDTFDALAKAGFNPILIRNAQPPVPESEVQTHEGTPVVLWAASLKHWKRPQLFIELARRCRDVDADFVMIGGLRGDGYRELVEAARRELPRFRYDGEIPLARVGEYFRKAHVVVCTSISEGYPNTFVQAWKRGVPVASLGIDPEKLVSEKRFGLVASTMDGLEKAVRELIAKPDLRREIGQRARAFAQEEHDVSRAVNRIEAILREHGVRVP